MLIERSVWLLLEHSNADWKLVNWSTILFNEMKFNMFQTTSRLSPLGQTCCVNSETSRWSKFIMVWGALSYQGPGILNVMHGNLNSQGYMDILCNCAILLAHLLWYGDEFWYHDDGVPCHRAKIVKEWHSQSSIMCLENWPSQPSDHTPIKILWHDIKMNLGNKHDGYLRELSMFVIPGMS
jgi:hypothetical protein